MKYAKESRAVHRLRKKIKERLKIEAKFMSKRMLKKISKVMQLKLAKNILDTQLKQQSMATHQDAGVREGVSSAQLGPLAGHLGDMAPTDSLDRLKKRIQRTEKKLSDQSRNDLKIKPITSGLRFYAEKLHESQAAPSSPRKAKKLSIQPSNRHRSENRKKPTQE